MRSMRLERIRLSRASLPTCRERRHIMTRVHWVHTQHSDKPKGFGHWVGYAKCTKCGAYLRLNTHPLPNEIDISGESVAVNCRY